jgi:hypothetical protein
MNVESGNFESVRMPALRSHVLSRASATNDVVISQSLARARGLAEPIGVQLIDDGGRRLVVVGVVRDVDLLSFAPGLAGFSQHGPDPTFRSLYDPNGHEADGGCKSPTQFLRQVSALK